MADPTPVHSLPGCEYIEIYNRSAREISLRGWSIAAGKSVIQLPDSTILPGEYLIVSDTCPLNYGSDFKLLITNLPHITNTGQTLTLKDPGGAVIHSVKFSDDWYNNEDKDDGGWSLEMIDTDNPCGGRNNWNASFDESGGSPGRKNSVSKPNPDHSPPIIMNAALLNDSSVILHFNEPVYYPDAFETRLFSVDQGFYHPESAYPVDASGRDIMLKYRGSFKSNQVYHVTILKELQDCAGNTPGDGLFARFSFTEPAVLSDIIINEVLFEAGKSIEFIELYNKSDKVIDLATLELALAGKSNVIEKSINISNLPASVFPGEYRVICRNGDKLAGYYSGIDPVTVSEAENIFTLPDEGGLLVVQDTAGQLIDEFLFSKDLHYSLLSSTAGVSVERISFGLPSNDRSNWHSASYLSGYASPGKRNSQQSANDEEAFALSSSIVSPDGDGIDDEVYLYFNLTEPGWTGDIAIFSLHGQKIKTILSNKLLGTSDIFTWNGSTDDGDMVSPGTYLVFAEFFSSKGEIKKFKKVISAVTK